MNFLNISSSVISSNNKYKTRREQILNAYKDKVYAYNLVRREALKEEDPETFDKKSKNIVPSLSFITNNLCKIYDQPVIREIDEVNKNHKNLGILFDIVNKAFKKEDKNIDITTFLTSTTLVKPYYDRDLDKFKFIVYGSNYCDMTSFPTDPVEPKEIKVSYPNNDVTQTEIWDYNQVKLYTDYSNHTTERNPYGFLPFVKFANEEDSFSYFTPPKDGLLDMQNSLSIKLINTDKTFKYQSRSLLVLSSDTKELEELNIGPSLANQIGMEDKLEFIKPDAELNTLIDFIKQEFSLLSKMYNIPDSIFDLNSNRSGVSIVRSKAEINEYLKERKEKFRDYEKELFIKSIKMLAIDKNIDIPEDFDINITYKERKEALTDLEIKEWEFLLNNNVKTAIDLLMSREDLTREEAEAKYEENKKINEERNLISSSYTNKDENIENNEVITNNTEE